MSTMKISIVIPAYNEEKHIEKCVVGLLNQDYPDKEIIVIDDGSTDKTQEILQKFSQKQQIIFLKQNHLGPGCARNLGAAFAGGEILVFVDADMSFSASGGFMTEIVKPIVAGRTRGTFSKKEYVANWDKEIAKFWQYNRGIYSSRMIPETYPPHAPIFRAILKSEFQKVYGFDTEIGYTDDWSLSRKLGYESEVAAGAKYYHFNPETWDEVWIQAMWIGKNEFISGNLLRMIKSFLRYNLIASVVKGLIISMRVKKYRYLFFQIVYDFAVFTAMLQTVFKKSRIK